MNTSNQLFCEYCGAANERQAIYCCFCGKPLHESRTTRYDDESGTLLIGTTLKNRYRIIKVLGQGGMGTVYRAQDTALNDRPVAIKEIILRNATTAEDAQDSTTFQSEATMLASLQHPNLPTIFEYFEENGRGFLVMSFLPGETLEAYLERTKRAKLPLNEVLQISKQLCTVLHYLHSQRPPIIFRDIKPANIMRAPDGRIYLIDFGVARRFKAGQKKDTVPFGSIGYAAPEQFGKAQTTPRSDIYSLGATIYQLLSGQEPGATPGHFPPLQTLEPTLPTKLVTLVEQMIARHEDSRPANILLVEQKLQEIESINVSAQTTGTPPPSQPATGWQRSANRLVMTLVALFCIVVSGMIGNSFGESNANDAYRRQRDATATVADATATAVIGATATAVQVVAMPDPYTTKGTLALVDPLSEAGTWQPWEDSSFGGSCEFKNEKLQIQQKGPLKFFICDESTFYHNFVMEAKMTIVEGDCGSVIIREKTDESQSYPLEICSDGHYSFNWFHDKNNWDALSKENSPAAFHLLGETNTVAIVALDDTFTLYANGKKIETISDKTLDMGVIGLAADSEYKDTTVTFQDVRIWVLP